jgi:polyhydroxybutyrate depolymerase
MKWSLLLGSLLFVATFLGEADAQLTSGDHRLSMNFNGYDRLYDVHVPPAYDGTSAVPLVLDFHGFSSNMEAQAALSAFNTLSDANGFIVAYPQGLFGLPSNPLAINGYEGPSWNGGNLCCAAAADNDVDDVGFARAVVSAIALDANIDLRRVYATGLSNGGAMTQRIACDAADTFAAAAPVAFPIAFDPLSLCRPARPMPLLAFAGLTDILVPYDGGHLSNIEEAPVVVSAQESFAQWRDLSGCGSGLPDETIVTGSSTCEHYNACSDGATVSLCSVLGTEGLGHILYINDDLAVSEMIWEFFSGFQLPSLCLALPAEGCRGGGKASLSIKAPNDPAKASLKWKLSKADETLLADLGDPTSTTSYALCLYDAQGAVPALKTSISVAPGNRWKAIGKGFKYADKTAAIDGAISVQLKSGGAGKAKVSMKAGGTALRAPTPRNESKMFTLDGATTVQLLASNGECWTSDFTVAKKNDVDKFKAKAP